MGSPDVLLRRAVAARQRGQVDEERAVLDLAARNYPDDPRVQNGRGMRALADGDLAGAIEAFGRAIAADPGEPSLLLNLATAHRRRGDDAAERHSLQRALNLDQRDFMAQLRMAELLERLGDTSASVRHWSAVIQLAGTMADPPPMVTDAARRGTAVMAAHNAAYEAALKREIGDDLPDDAATHRFRVCVDHMLGRRRIYRNHCAGIHYPFLPAVEFFDRAMFPWFGQIEARVPAMREEALALLNVADASAIRPYVQLDPGTPENRWTALDGSLEWSACFLWEYGIRNDAVCDHCPETAAALASAPVNHVPGKAPSAFFSILRPGGHIPPHTGVTNARAIVHLPLVVPDGCRFRVGGETRSWREGEAFAFDDTIEHEAWNDSDQQRIVLIFDVWNPYLTETEQSLLTKLFTVADRGISAAKAG